MFKSRLPHLTLFLLLILASASSAEPTKIGVAGSPPFVETTGQVTDGISIRIWDAVAELESIEYEMVKFATVEEALKAVEAGEIQVAVGPISITSERAARLAFTQPYFSSGLGILSHSREKSFGEKIRPFFSTAFFYGVFFLTMLLGLVGLLVWLCERKANDQFPEGPTGLAAGMWFAIVTMTTVGYGDKCPDTAPGRLLTAVWMLIATISYSTLTAGIATALTLSSLDSADISSPEGLRGHRVAVVAGTTSADAAKHFDTTALNCKNLEQAVERLKDNSVDAVIFDHPALRHLIQKSPQDQLRLSRSTFESQNYGFAVAQDSELQHRFNVALLKLWESGQMKDIEDRWLAESTGG